MPPADTSRPEAPRSPMVDELAWLERVAGLTSAQADALSAALDDAERARLCARYGYPRDEAPIVPLPERLLDPTFVAALRDAVEPEQAPAVDKAIAAALDRS